MALDGFRGLAVLIVVICHVAVLMLPPDARAAIAFLHLVALLPVILLFVMSGFLIGASSKRLMDRGAFGIRRYAIYRVARIYPGFLLSVAIVWLVALAHVKGWLNGQETRLIGTFVPTPEALLRDVMFLFSKNTPTQNINGPVWSLRFEIIFYILMGLAMLALTRTGLSRWLFLLLALGLVGASLMRLQDAWMALAAFGAGVICAWRPGAALRMRRWPLWPAVFLLAAIQFAATAGLADRDPWIIDVGKQALHGALILASMSAIARRENGLSPAQAGVSPFAALAPSSYTLYVIHYPVLILVVGLVAIPEDVAGRTGLGLGMLALAIAVAHGAARFTEQRDLFRKWLDRVVPGRS